VLHTKQTNSKMKKLKKLGTKTIKTAQNQTTTDAAPE
jgi:hypothetical protein